MAQFHPDAADKLIESARFYEQQASGLGERFLKTVETAVGQASAHPELYPVIHADAVRLCLVHLFPYAILFEALPEDIVALAVMHQHRRPGYWADRLAAPHHQPNHHGGAA
ncbi:MAG: type II toxin-antitoxin system RelE/ParE family toxin [Kiritimatiellae bacterium]|nr:type II toxin-antitoxin system RelE/ParE family toxin [Kiritimatiellia bacterium]